MSGEYKIHPFADQFPLLSGRELRELADDIAVNGQRDPILLSLDGTTVYDGRNRLAAIALLPGVEPITKRVDFDDEQVVELIISYNLKRRHLTASQRAMLGAAGLKELERIAKERFRARRREAASRQVRDDAGRLGRTVAPDVSGATRKRAGGHDSGPAKVMASAVGVSPASIDRAKRILREDKDLAAKVQGGQMSIGQARQQLRKAKAKEVQPEPAQEPDLNPDMWMPPHGAKPPAFIRTPPARLARIEWIRVGAAQGLRAEDIAKGLGIGAGAVRRMAKEASVEFRVASRTKKPNFDPERLLDLLVDDLGSMASTYIERIETRLPDVDAAKLPEYVAALKERRTPITRLINQLERAIDDLPERTFQ